MFSSVLGNLFMILASQAQKDAPKAVQSTAQVQKNTAQIDSSAFNLLLAFVNTGANGPAEGAVDFADDLGADSSADDLGKDSLADQAALPAKIADWLASNPASLAALKNLASGAGGVSAHGASAALVALLAESGVSSSQVETNPGPGTYQDLSLVSAIEQAIDSQSMAAALMAAVSAGVNKSASDDKAVSSSNLLLARGLNGQMSLADVLAKASTDVGMIATFGGGLLEPKLGQTDSSLTKTGLEDLIDLAQPSSGGQLAVDQANSSRATARLSDDEQKQRQLEQADVLLSTGLPGTTHGLDELKQAMSAQTLGRASIANANALEGTVSWLASQQGGSATIDLSPPELGSLRLELKIDAAGESAVLIVHAANEAAKAAIEQSLDRLYESFQSSGMALQVSVGSGSSQFAGMFSNGFDDRSKQIQGLNRSPDGSRVGAIATTSRAGGVATDALSLYA